MFNEKMVLCASNAYEKKYYLNDQFSNLPEQCKTGIADYVCAVYRRSRWNSYFAI